MEPAIAKILARADSHNLPAIPQVLLDLMEIFQSSHFAFEDLTHIISRDVSLSSKVLSAANSSFYRQWGELKDLNRVLVVLGLNTLKTLVMTSAVQQFFSQIPASRLQYLDAIWLRSLSCAHIARRLATLTAYEAPDQAYLTGLIHRLGQLVLLQCFPKDYSALLNEHSIDIDTPQEKRTIGTTHNEIAAYLLETWKMQSFMADAVLFQNHPVQSILDSPPLVKLINLASSLSRLNDKNAPKLYEQAYVLFGLNQALVETMLSELDDEIAATANSVGLSLSSAPTAAALQNRTEHSNRIQQRLAEQVKNLSLIGALGHTVEVPERLAKVIAQIQRDISVLFGFRCATLFLCDEEGQRLQGYHFGDRENEKLWSSLAINLKKNRSLLANALLNRQILDSFSASLPDPTPVVDRQICRLLGSEGLLAIPLFSNEQNLGVIVVDLNPTEVRKINTQKTLLGLFAGEAASALVVYRNVKQRLQDNVAAVRSGFQLQAKKIRHEAGNPLSIINNYLYLLGQKLGDQSPEELGLIREEIQRVGDILLRLSDTDETTAADTDRVDINRLIRDLVALFQNGLPAADGIAIHWQPDEKLPLIATSKSKLKQVLTNLIKNAVEALATGGNIMLTTRDRVYLGNNCCVEIKISDDGPGLTDDIKNHLFTPVASSKGASHSGLGLTIVKTLVDELSGTISCNSNTMDGTTFQLFLPRITQP